MAVVRAGQRRFASVFVSVMVATFLSMSQASASPAEPTPSPLSPLLAAQMAKNPSGPLRVLVHGSDLAAAERAVTATGMMRVIEFRRIGVVVATATAEQIEAARTQPGVTYIEGDQPVEFNTQAQQRTQEQGCSRAV